MTIRIIRLGSNRLPDEGLRIGTVRRPPRGVPKSEFSSGNWYDVWYPNLSPSPEVMKLGQEADTPEKWAQFEKRFKREMSEPDSAKTLDLLAALSHSANFSMGCYCESEKHCHRSVLRALLQERGAKLV